LLFFSVVIIILGKAPMTRAANVILPAMRSVKSTCFRVAGIYRS
jgi:hypothetical protein